MRPLTNVPPEPIEPFAGYMAQVAKQKRSCQIKLWKRQVGLTAGKPAEWHISFLAYFLLTLQPTKECHEG
jgi:hypothetical protein